MPALLWSALRESNSRHLVKSQVHSHYAKGEENLACPEGLEPPHLLIRSEERSDDRPKAHSGALSSLATDRMFGLSYRIRTGIDQGHVLGPCR